MYSGVCYDGFKLSVHDIIVSQKVSNGDGKLLFFGQNYNFTRTLCAKLFTSWKVELFETANERGEQGLEIIFVNVCVRYEGTKCQRKKVPSAL